MKGFERELKLQGENEIAGTFYRYNFGETQFWFTQKSDGKILAVSIRNKRYPDVEFFADDTKNQYYPNRIRFCMPHKEISSYKDEDEFNHMFQYLCEVRNELQDFFERSGHARLYQTKHIEELQNGEDKG